MISDMGPTYAGKQSVCLRIKNHVSITSVFNEFRVFGMRLMQL